MADPTKTMLPTETLPFAGYLPQFEIHMCSGLQETRSALDKILHALAPLQLDIEERAIVELVLAETINNIVEHAYPQDDSDGRIQIRCTHLFDGLHFTLFDQGQAMPNGTAPRGFSPDLNVEIDDLPEGGFGWFLIQDLAKDVCYQRTDGENKLSLRLAVAYKRDAQ